MRSFCCAALFSTLLAGALSAQPAGTGCSYPTNGICFNYGGDTARARRACERRPDAVFTQTVCPTAEVVARCTNQTSSGTIVTFFYYPQWTLNEVQERCKASGGTVSQ